MENRNQGSKLKHKRKKNWKSEKNIKTKFEVRYQKGNLIKKLIITNIMKNIKHKVKHNQKRI